MIRSAASSTGDSIVAPVSSPAACPERSDDDALGLVRRKHRPRCAGEQPPERAARMPGAQADREDGMLARSEQARRGRDIAPRGPGRDDRAPASAGASGTNATCTGPCGGSQAMRIAVANASSAPSRPSEVVHLVTGAMSASWSSRWCETRARSATGTASLISSIGCRSSNACAAPLTELATPGPRVTTHAPGTPVSSPSTPAMIAAAVSPWTSTKRRPARSQAPTTSRLLPPPGTP